MNVETLRILELTPAQRRRLREQTTRDARIRDGYECVARTKVPDVRCRLPLDPHEIIPRSAWKLGIYFLSNVVTVCRAHHDWIDDHPADAHKLGLHGFSWERPT